VNPILRAGVITVQIALLSYTVGVVQEQRRRRVTAGVKRWLTIGVFFDVVATACMMLGTERSLITPHGLLGYSALAAMLVDLVLLRRHAARHGEAEVPRGLHLYSRFAYLWWVVAYITGGALVMMSRRGG
jgi:hypothetical protein